MEKYTSIFTGDEIDSRLTKVTELEKDIGMHRKNQLPVTSGSIPDGAMGGMTVTVNDDKSITLDGCFTLGYSVQYPIVKGLRLKGRYILTGCPEGGGDSTYAIELRDRSQAATVLFSDTGSGAEVVFDEETEVDAFIRVMGLVQVDNVTFYPMLRYADVGDSDYEPYKPDLQAQIEQLAERIGALEKEG